VSTDSTPADALPERRRPPVWLLALAPLALVAVLLGVFLLAGAPGLERNGVPVEAVAVERTVLRPGQIELRLRNDGPDAVTLAQVIVNDAYIPLAAGLPVTLGRLESATVQVPYDWIEGEAYEIGVVTGTGGVVAAPVEVAAETPAGDAGFFGLLALIGLYVGVIPVAVGMLWLPFARRVRPDRLRFLMALTVGLLAFLAVDALVEGIEIAQLGPQAFGGPALVVVGALVAFVVLSGVDAWMRRRRTGTRGWRLALLIAVGIGLHNLGEGLAIGSAYAIGELALGAFLVVGFALHNTTEGLAIVAPIAHERPGPWRLLLLGLIAGLPAVLGAWIGGVAFSAPLSAFLLGFGVGAIVQVCLQLLPGLRERPAADGTPAPVLTPLTAGGMLTGVALMYATGLLIG
jgi:zinc transporter ZupT